MKKKGILIAIVIILVVCSAFSMTGCKKPISLNEAYDNLVLSLNNSLKEQVYLYNEIRRSGADNKDVFTRTANVYSPLIDQKKGGYEFEFDEQGRLKNLAITASESDWRKELDANTFHVSYKATKADTKKTKKEYKNILMRTVARRGTGDEKEKKVETYDEIDAYTFRDSEAFARFELSERIKVLSTIKFEDIVFENDGKKHYATKSAKVMAFAFKLSDEYYERYLAEYGVESPLKADKIFVETAYNRISNVCLYNFVKAGTILPEVEDELYNIKIAYYGPIIRPVRVKYEEMTRANDLLQIVN